jgi:hypothetical protein
LALPQKRTPSQTGSGLRQCCLKLGSSGRGGWGVGDGETASVGPTNFTEGDCFAFASGSRFSVVRLIDAISSNETTHYHYSVRLRKQTLWFRSQRAACSHDRLTTKCGGDLWGSRFSTWEAAMIAHKFAAVFATTILGIAVAVAVAHPSAVTQDAKFPKAAKFDVSGGQPDTQCPKIAWPYGCEWHASLPSPNKHILARQRSHHRRATLLSSHL